MEVKLRFDPSCLSVSVGWSFIWLGPSVCRSVCHNVKFHFPCSYRSPCFRALALFSSDCWKIEFLWMNEYVLGDTHYCILLSTYTSLLSAQKNWRTFDVISVDFLRRANKQCEYSYQNAKSVIFNGLFLHLYEIFRNSEDVANITYGYLFIHQNLIFFIGLSL